MSGEIDAGAALTKALETPPSFKGKGKDQAKLAPDHGSKEQIDPRTQIAIRRLAQTAKSTVQSTA